MTKKKKSILFKLILQGSWDRHALPVRSFCTASFLRDICEVQLNLYDKILVSNMMSLLPLCQQRNNWFSKTS